MIDLGPVFRREQTMAEVVGGLSPADLRRESNELIDAMLGLIEACDDADVAFVPVDPAASDDAASSAAEANVAWTLGHVVVHATASAEETAFLGAELARGVPNHGRSRYEVPWENIATVEQARARLEESRRMILACLDLWPAEPHLELTHEVWPGGPVVNAVGYAALGLGHGFGHLAQLGEIVRQSKAARG